jgi:LmbE family N-acetylglucosaminyl deacetylase
MLPFALSGITQPRRILCLGAHSDDIEIGCGGTVLALLEGHASLEIQWVVCSADGIREHEARASADRFLNTAAAYRIVIEHFRDGFFPFEGARIKEFFEDTVREFAPDVIFTHHSDDRHQDHRLISDLTWQTFRDHLILEYEVPKYDGDLGRPNCFVPLSESHSGEKIRHLLESFGSQRGKRWFTEETFRGLMRLRGIECAAASGLAEAFYARKLMIGTPHHE